MAFSMKLWQVVGQDLQEVSDEVLDNETPLERRRKRCREPFVRRLRSSPSGE